LRDLGRIGPCFDSQRETSGLFDLCLGLVSNKRMASTKFAEVPGLADNVDFIVATTPISASVTKPVIKGLAFLTGIGKDKILDEIEAQLRK